MSSEKSALWWLCDSVVWKQHDPPAIMYPIIYTHHRLHINNGTGLQCFQDTTGLQQVYNRFTVFPGYNSHQKMMVKPPQTNNHGKIWQQWWERCWFDDDNDNKILGRDGIYFTWVAATYSGVARGFWINAYMDLYRTFFNHCCSFW